MLNASAFQQIWIETITSFRQAFIEPDREENLRTLFRLCFSLRDRHTDTFHRNEKRWLPSGMEIKIGRASVYRPVGRRGKPRRLCWGRRLSGSKTRPIPLPFWLTFPKRIDSCSIEEVARIESFVMAIRGTNNAHHHGGYLYYSYRCTPMTT